MIARLAIIEDPGVDITPLMELTKEDSNALRRTVVVDEFFASRYLNMPYHSLVLDLNDLAVKAPILSSLCEFLGLVMTELSAAFYVTMLGPSMVIENPSLLWLGLRMLGRVKTLPSDHVFAALANPDNCVQERFGARLSQFLTILSLRTGERGGVEGGPSATWTKSRTFSSLADVYHWLATTPEREMILDLGKVFQESLASHLLYFFRPDQKVHTRRLSQLEHTLGLVSQPVLWQPQNLSKMLDTLYRRIPAGGKTFGEERHQR